MPLTKLFSEAPHKLLAGFDGDHHCGGINPYTLTTKLGLARIDGFGPPERRRAAQLT